MGSKLSTTFWSFKSSTSRPDTNSLEVEKNSKEEIKNRDRTASSGRGENSKLEKLQIKKKNRRRRKRQKSKKKDKVCVEKMDDGSQSESVTCSTELPNKNYINMNKENIVVKNKSDMDTNSFKRATKMEYSDNGIGLGTTDAEARYEDDRLAEKKLSTALDNFKEVRGRRGNRGSNKILKKPDATKSRDLNGRNSFKSGGNNIEHKNKRAPSTILGSARNNVCARSSNTISSVPQQNDGSSSLGFQEMPIDPMQGATSTLIDPMMNKDQAIKISSPGSSLSSNQKSHVLLNKPLHI